MAWSGAATIAAMRETNNDRSDIKQTWAGVGTRNLFSAAANIHLLLVVNVTGVLVGPNGRLNKEIIYLNVSFLDQAVMMKSLERCRAGH